MKNLKYILCTFFVGVLVSSCDSLDLQPKGLIDEGTLFKSQDGIEKYFADLYNDLPIEDFNYSMTEGYYNHGDQTWEAMKESPSTAAMETAGRLDGMTACDFWKYDKVREINTFLQDIPNYKDNYTDDDYNALLGEAHFLRAFYYFGMVKRYGGVPIVDVVQDPTMDLDSLQVTRNTEEECWNFIHDDLQFAMENASADRTNTSRGNRYAAAALMSRAMLYAASNAKYGAYSGITGPATNAGLMGMSSDKAVTYYQYAYDACKFLQSAGFTLHAEGDKVQGYVDVFVNDCSADEDIFVKQYGPYTTTPFNMKLTHCWDAMALPLGTGMSVSVGCCIQPVWELLRLFQMPAIEDADGKPVRFNKLSDIWNNNEIEARAKADIFFPGMTEPVSGTVFDFQNGIYTSYPGTTADGCPDASTNDYTTQYRIYGGTQGATANVGGKILEQNGLNGINTTSDEGYIYTGTSIRKYVSTASDRGGDLYESHTPFKVFRYGEILCNWAEAAYELGLIKGDDNLKQEAITHVNELRDRAGAKPYTYVANPQDVGTPLYGFPVDENLQYIRDERERELCFENETYWDQRRWRISDILYQNTISHNLAGYYVADENKYIFLPDVNTFGRRLTFDRKAYYQDIPGDEINKNPKLVHNDGY